jgi:hypothetical protein
VVVVATLAAVRGLVAWPLAAAIVAVGLVSAVGLFGVLTQMVSRRIEHVAA